MLRKAEDIISLATSSWFATRWLLLIGFPESSGGRISCQYHSTMVLHAHISPRGWTVATLAVAVQRRSLTSSTWSVLGIQEDNLLRDNCDLWTSNSFITSVIPSDLMTGRGISSMGFKIIRLGISWRSCYNRLGGGFCGGSSVRGNLYGRSCLSARSLIVNDEETWHWSEDCWKNASFRVAL
jgi:hypothetical protein